MLTRYLAVLLVLFLSAGIEADCICNDMEITSAGHSPVCGCDEPADSSHCADTCPCPVCCKIDDGGNRLMPLVSVFGMNPRTVIRTAAMPPAECPVVLPEDVTPAPDRTDPGIFPSAGAGLCLDNCVLLI